MGSWWLMTWVRLRLATEQAKLGTTCSGGTLSQNEMQLPLWCTEDTPLHPFCACLRAARLRKRPSTVTLLFASTKKSNAKAHVDFTKRRRRNYRRHFLMAFPQRSSQLGNCQRAPASSTNNLLGSMLPPCTRRALLCLNIDFGENNICKRL